MNQVLIDGYIAKAVERAEKHNLQPKLKKLRATDHISLILQGNFTIFVLVRDKQIFTGVSKKTPEDVFRIEAGAAIAVGRAVISSAPQPKPKKTKGKKV